MSQINRLERKMKYFYLVRHGQTDLNTQQCLQGKMNVGKLTEIGKKQAIDAGKKLKTFSIKKAYCSPLNRAQESFNLMNTELNIKDVETTSLLAERSFGIYESKTLDEIERCNVEHREIIEKMDVFKNIPEGEPLYHVGARMFRFIAQLGDSVENGHYLFVTHGNCITALKWLLEKEKSATARNMKIGNGEFIRVAYENGCMSLLEDH